MSNAYEPPKEVGDGKRRYDEKTKQKARFELRKWETRFISNLAVTRVSYYALGIFGLFNTWIGHMLMSRIFRDSAVTVNIVAALQGGAAVGFIVFGILMKKVPGTAIKLGWAFTAITLLAGPLFNPLMFLSIFTYVLPILQMLSLLFVTKFAIQYQNRRRYLTRIIES